MVDLSPERLAELKALEKAATPGPWEYSRWSDGDGCRIGPHRDPMLNICEEVTDEPDANFIAALRNVAPALIAAAEERDQLSRVAFQAQEMAKEIAANNASLRALLVRAGEAMETISNRRYVSRGTVAESNAFAWFEKSNKELVEVYDAARSLAAEIHRATQPQEPKL